MKKKILITLGLIFAVIIALDFRYYVAWSRSVDAYQACINSPGSSNIEPDPPTCWYADGTEINQLRRPEGIAITLLR